ncbi:hypothetical protein V6N13_014942 [Hibiscus sabdariffa]
MQEETKCMEAWLIAAESALEEKKRILSEYKSMAKLADDLLSVFMKESHENNGEELDEETTKELVEEAMRDFTGALNELWARSGSSLHEMGFKGTHVGHQNLNSNESGIGMAHSTWVTTKASQIGLHPNLDQESIAPGAGSGLGLLAKTY